MIVKEGTVTAYPGIDLMRELSTLKKFPAIHETLNLDAILWYSYEQALVSTITTCLYVLT